MNVRNRQALYFSLVFPVITMLVLKLVLGKTTLANGMNYVDFVIPGLITMSILQMAIFAIAFVVAQYKEKGVLKRLMATPMRPIDFLSAQVLSRLIISVAQVILLVSTAILALNFTFHGSYLSLIILTILGALVFLSLGFIVAGISKTVETVPAIANLIIFPMIIFGNIFFPLNSAPNWLQTIADKLPVRYLADGMRDVMTGGLSLYDIRGDILGLLVWLVIFAFIAQRVFSLAGKDN